MVSSSRTDPPGSATARTPASARISKPSGNGKYASLAAPEPAARSPARSTARRAESTRLTWPMPTPTEAPPEASRMAFDLTARHAFQAKARSASWAGPAGGPALSSQFAGSSPGSATRSTDWSRIPPLTGRHSTPSVVSGAAQRSRRTFLLADRMSSASSSKPGATTTSVNTSAICRARSAVTGPLAAMTPPKAETGSHALALACAGGRVGVHVVVVRHGLAVQQFGGRDAGAGARTGGPFGRIKSGPLVRVLAVAQDLSPAPEHPRHLRPASVPRGLVGGAGRCEP